MGAGLGPHVVGQRVVVRRVLPGERGATGGPAFTDALGVLETWADGDAVIRTESGEAVRIPVRDIVSGKPVPPRASVHMRVPAGVAQRRALASWPAAETATLGAWVLRAAGGYSGRANSVLADGDPGLDLDAAVERVRHFYAQRGLPSWAQVVVGSEVHAALAARGASPARPGEADTLFQLASVATALRRVRRQVAGGRGDQPATQVTVSPRLDDAWLGEDGPLSVLPEGARAVLEGPPDVGLLTVSRGADGPVLARGRVARGSGDVPGDEDWAGITSLWVHPGHRRQGLGTVLMGAALDWAAERGAATAYLQVRGDNPAALAAYERLGFRTHHAYRYLVT